MAKVYSGTYTSGITLSNWAQDNPVTIDAGASINSGNVLGGAAGVAGGAGPQGYVWTLTNLGAVASQQQGVYLNGSLTNDGSITGYQGVMFGAVGSLTNTAGGRIIATGTNATVGGQAVRAGAGAVIDNAGYILGAYGVGLYGAGTVTNLAGGTIAGTGTISKNDVGVALHAGGTVINAGLIESLTAKPAYDYGITMGFAGGTVVNQKGGTISATGGVGIGTGGIELATITNAGLISGAASGVNLLAGGTLANQAGGVIVATGGASSFGVQVYAQAGMLTNAGSIGGGGGIILARDGSVTNAAGGTISGSSGAGIVLGDSIAQGGPDPGGTVTNAGLVTGHSYGILLQSSYSHALTNTGTIIGAIGIDGQDATPGDTIVNRGAIISSGGTAGIALRFGQPAGGLQGTASNLLAVYPGAVFVGQVIGNTQAGASNTIDLRAGGGQGTLAGFGSLVTDFQTIAFDPGASWAISGAAGGLGGAITGFAHGDTIDVTGVTATGFSAGAGTLTLDTAAAPVTLNLSGSFAPGQLSVANTAAGAEVTVACFAEGTRIATPDGDVPVQDLRIGDRVRTARGDDAEVRWLGWRRLDCRRHPRPQDVWPVRIRAGALGGNRPARDLWLSPDHAVFLDGVLIPVRYLLNDTTIVQERAAEIRYWHVELPRHDVLLAEGAPCESYLDTGNRAAFANGDGPTALHPDFALPPDFALRVWDSDACARLVRDGAILAAARSRLLACAETLGHRRTGDPALAIRADGHLCPAIVEGARWRLCLPPGTALLRLRSRAWVPARMTAAETDTRTLGIAVAQLTFDGHPVPLDDPRLASGWLAPEPGWRCTDGDAALCVAGVREVAFSLPIAAQYWQRPARRARRRATAPA